MATPQALDLISMMITWDPKVRPSCNECLQHVFFGNTGSSTAIKRNSTIASKQSTRGDKQSDLQRFRDPANKRRVTLNNFEDNLQNLAELRVGGLKSTQHQNSSPQNIHPQSYRSSSLCLAAQMKNSAYDAKRTTKNINKKLSLNGNNIVFQNQGSRGDHLAQQSPIHHQMSDE